MEILRYGDAALEAGKEIRQIQQGEKPIINTGRPWLDDHFPVLTGSVILVAALSGVGKSFELQRLKRNILNKELNPLADNFVFLDISLEMKIRSLVLRELSGKLKKKKRDILLEGFNEEETKLAREYFEDLRNDKRQFISQKPTNPEKFYSTCKNFLEQHKDKDLVCIGVDHLALIGVAQDGSRNSAIEAFVERVNDLKIEFSNVLFILLNQCNSDFLLRAKDKDVKSQPSQKDIYYSQFSFQIADYVIVAVSPYNMGIREYTKIRMDRYPNLEKYFLAPDGKGRASLETYGVIYYHILKMRDADEGTYLNIYAEDLGFSDAGKVREENKKKDDIVGNVPMFDNVVFNTDALSNARGSFDDEGGEPF